MVLLELKEGMAGGNTPLKAYLLALGAMYLAPHFPMRTSVTIDAIFSKKFKKKVGKFAWDIIELSIAGNWNIARLI